MQVEANVRTFEAITGLHIGGWVREEQVREQAELLKTVLRDGLEGYRQQMRRLAKEVERVGQDLRKALGDEDD